MPSRSSAPGRGSGRSRLLYVYVALVAIALLAFAIVIVGRLPYDRFARLAIDRAAIAAGIEIRYASSVLGWRGVELSDVEVEIEPNRAAHPHGAEPIRVDRLTLRPSLWGLLRGHRGMPWTAQAHLDDGTAHGVLGGRPAAWHLRVKWTQVDLGQLPPPRPDGRITGVCNGWIEASTTADGTQGRWVISARQLTISGLRGGHLVLPTLEVSQADARGTWTGRRVTVEELDAEGSFGELHLAGRIMRRQPLEKSALNLQMTHVPPSNPPAELALFFKIFLPGKTTGEQRYNLGGTLGLPTITPQA